jgi:hypothetical protein
MKILLKRIVNHQILNASNCPNLGLFDGKMGCVIFFFHYARYTGESLYEDFAGELLDEIYEDIHTETPFDFLNGLLGIGFGIEYLIHQKFVKGNGDEILIDIDKKIMERNPCNITDHSMETGFEGMAWYILSRLCSSKTTPFEATYLNNFQYSCSCLYLKENTEGIQLFLAYRKGEKIIDLFIRILQKIVMRKEENFLSWQNGLKMLIQ